MPIDPSTRTALIQAVRAAARTEIVPRFRTLQAGDIRTKSSALDLVTDADERAERHIRAAVATLLPDARIVGEEGVAAGRDSLDTLDRSGLSVVIDPVDGTWNFARGLALFGTLLAVVRDGQTLFGLLYDPLHDDWIEATRGDGTWLVRGDLRTRLRLSDPPPWPDMTGLHSAHDLTRAQWRAAADLHLTFGRVTTLRASVWDYRLMLTGGAGFAMNRHLKPWDHAAGVLALQEAGGHAQLLDGPVYAPHLRDGYLLCAQSRALWDDLAPGFSEALLAPLRDRAS